MVVCHGCTLWEGTPENEGLCSSCFRDKFPEKVAERAAKQKKRLEPVEHWEATFTTAIEGKDGAQLATLVETAVKATSDTGDGDDQLCQRHAKRLEVIFEKVWYDAFREPTIPHLSLLVEAKVPPLPNPRALFRHLLRNSGYIPIFDYLVKDPAFRSAVDAELLEAAMYATTTPVNRPPWVERILAVEFEDTVHVTSGTVAKAKYTSSSTNGGSSAETRRIQELVNAAFKKRNARMAAERKAYAAMEKGQGAQANPTTPEAAAQEGPAVTTRRKKANPAEAAPKPAAQGESVPKSRKKANPASEAAPVRNTRRRAG